jgi:NAD(P)-dependent dehydrogenase (short-subunit alcohol dehydrogenase family)
VVTGAASGIGRALAERFAREGMRVLLADVKEAAFAQVVRELEAAGHRALGVATDVRRREQVDALAARAIAAFGAVHVLCNNAGVLAQSEGAGAIRELPLPGARCARERGLRGDLAAPRSGRAALRGLLGSLPPSRSRTGAAIPSWARKSLVGH